jgi:hypothetical protein
MLNYFFRFQFLNGSERQSISEDNFRAAGLRFLMCVAAYYQYSGVLIRDESKIFLAKKYINLQALIRIIRHCKISISIF